MSGLIDIIIPPLLAVVCVAGVLKLSYSVQGGWWYILCHPYGGSKSTTTLRGFREKKLRSILEVTLLIDVCVVDAERGLLAAGCCMLLLLLRSIVRSNIPTPPGIIL